MKQRFMTILAMLFMVSSLGCASGGLTTREKGAIGGTAAGAGLGAIIGAGTGYAGAGAGIGATVGILKRQISRPCGTRKDNHGSCHFERT